MKINYLLLSILFITSITLPIAQNQNPGWCLPPKVQNFNLNSQYNLPPILNVYESASNMQLDAAGNILFYILDDLIYDKDGEVIAQLSLFNTTFQKTRTSEIAIIPDPNNCQRYYFITSGQHRIAGNNVEYNVPFVGVLNYELIRTGNPSKFGALEYFNLISDISTSPYYVNWTGNGSGVFMAASRLKNNDSRFVFLSNQYKKAIYRYKIDSNGIKYDGTIPFASSPNQNLVQGMQGEMELVELPSGNYRIAVPYDYNKIQNGKKVSCAVYIAELDGNGVVISGNENTLFFYESTNSQNDPYIHGLEFSPDGSKLFLTHNISQYHSKPFEYYDFNSYNISDPNGNGIYSMEIGTIPNIDPQNFESSQIELGKDGKIYLGSEGRLAKLNDDPNNPNPNLPSFNDNAIIVSGYKETIQGASYGAAYHNKSYTLPDQIDGMPYESFSTNIYNSISYTAISSGIWSIGNTNNPWNSNGDVFIKEKLVIPAGKNITIENMTFHFGPEAKVIIEPGAKLIIDGSILTNSKLCGNEEFYWRGVEVWGTSNQHQYPANSSTYQGMLILKNGGTIENAHTAATNWKQDDWSKIGGVIQSTNGFFRNNRRDVAFMSYTNFLPTNSSIKVPDFSSFKNTEFVSDNNLIEKGYPVGTHITMWEVSGINFTNCHFANNITVNKDNSSAPNQGIYSIDAGYKVLAGCSTSPPFGQTCPTSNLLKSSFTGLSNAVAITGSSTTRSVTIQQSEFIDNVYAISVDEFDNVSINRNHIEIGNAGYTLTWPIGIGINLNNSTGYIVEENKVISSLASGYYLGINVTNGGEDDHRLYKNILEDLTNGTTAYGLNHNSNYQKGLQFLCNEYKNNAIGISIQSTPTSDGVRFYQGNFSPKQSSGNTFINNTSDIKNSANSIVYYYNGTNSLPVNFTGMVDTVKAAKANSCPSSFVGGIIMRPLALLKQDLDNLNVEYADLNFTYTSLIDGGNTEQFKNNIEINWSDDAWHLREKLIEKSPYLSSEVLLKVAGQNILPNGMLLEVLLANPDATRTESFIENLRNETNNSFPEYMINYVKNNWDVKTLRTNLEGEISSIHSELAVTRNYIKYLEKSEEEYTLADRLNTMKIGNSLSHKVGLMDFYIESNQFTKADSVLQAVMNDKTMKDELKQIEYYEDYLSFRSSIDGRNLAQLDSNEIIYLQTLAENAGRVGGYAKNVLCFFYDICFEKEFPTENLVEKSMSTSANSPELEDILYNITLYPNPSDEFASIKWEIYDQIQNASYKVFDLNGLEVMSNIIDSNKDEKVIDTRSLKSGVYIVGIYNNDKIKVNKKLVVNPKK